MQYSAIAADDDDREVDGVKYGGSAVADASSRPWCRPYEPLSSRLPWLLKKLAWYSVRLRRKTSSATRGRV